MSSATAIRLQIETVLGQRIPSALTPAPKTIRPVAATGIETLDNLLQGGLPVGALTELVGPECSGRTSIALSFVARITQASKVCAWIDVSNALDPSAAAALGVDLKRLLWVRCGVLQKSSQRPKRTFVLPEKYLTPPPATKGLHGGGYGSHPRSEARRMSEAVGDLLHPGIVIPRRPQSLRRIQDQQMVSGQDSPSPIAGPSRSSNPSPWARIDQAMRAADLVLQGGGFSAIVLDMGGLQPEHVSRIRLDIWHRYRLAAERTQSSILLLSQHACPKSSAELQLHLSPVEALSEEATVFSGIRPHVEVLRQRFTQASTNVVPLRKPPQRTQEACWPSRTTWAGPR